MDGAASKRAPIMAGQSHIGLRRTRHSREGGNPAPRFNNTNDCWGRSPAMGYAPVLQRGCLFGGATVSSLLVCGCPAEVTVQTCGESILGV